MIILYALCWRRAGLHRRRSVEIQTALLHSIVSYTVRRRHLHPVTSQPPSWCRCRTSEWRAPRRCTFPARLWRPLNRGKPARAATAPTSSLAAFLRRCARYLLSGASRPARPRASCWFCAAGCRPSIFTLSAERRCNASRLQIRRSCRCLQLRAVRQSVSVLASHSRHRPENCDGRTSSTWRLAVIYRRRPVPSYPLPYSTLRSNVVSIQRCKPGEHGRTSVKGQGHGATAYLIIFVIVPAASSTVGRWRKKAQGWSGGGGVHSVISLRRTPTAAAVGTVIPLSAPAQGLDPSRL